MRRSFTPHGAANSQTAALSESANDVTGVLERITFHDPENGYTVGRLKSDDSLAEITVVGTFSAPVVGQYLRCEGVWINHPQWGRQLQVRTYETIVPATAAAIEKYLGSGMVKGIGPVTAQRIVAKYGDESLDVIENSPDKLLAVKGIGAKLLERIVGAWTEQREVRNIMIFLQSHGVTPVFAAKIYKAYKGKSIEVVERNPYQLATDIRGVGFRSADRIAQNLGFALDDPRRLIAGVVYALNAAVETGGNVFLTREELCDAAEQMLGTREIGDALDALVSEDKLIREFHSPAKAGAPGAVGRRDAVCRPAAGPDELDYDSGDIPPDPFELDMASARQGKPGATGSVEEAYYIPSLYFAEVGVAASIRRRCAAGLSGADGVRDISGDWVARCMSRHGLSLSAEQQSAVELAIRSPFMVLTGGPGTGKTTTTRAIVHAFTDLHRRVLLASPTGRAAKRLTEVTGFEASTIHRMLAYDPGAGGFRFGPESPLDCDVLIVDEASMLDIVLANSLLRATRPETRVILIGDVDQLPSVGPGNVLRDLIASGIVPVAWLTQVFRQAAASRIVTNAHRVNRGQMPELPPPKDETSDFVFVRADEAQEVADKVVAIVVRSLPRRGHNVADIQVLVPMQKGAAGAIALNARLQEALNPPVPDKPQLEQAGKIFRVGDRVIQLRNNYDRGTFNGDIGTISAVSHSDNTLTVRMSDIDMTYDFTECDELAHAYALTIHKSQGSEFPVAVIAVHTQHYILLQRNLLYTAITRARRYAVVVGNTRALGICVKNDKHAERHTRLKPRLAGEL
jgi:exodeoxyribonuclease V alpha subunit